MSGLREAVEVMLRRATAGKSPATHIERARALKAEGNEKFLAGDYRAALAAHHASYLWASGFAEWGGGPRVPEAHESFWTAMMPRLCAPASADELQQLRELQAAHHANLALCHMKLQQHERARDDCTRCLAIQPSHVKALLRRALCHASLDAIDDAHDDLEAVLAAQPHNSEALAKMAEIKPRLAQREKETKKRFQKLFKAEKTAAAAPSDAAAVVVAGAAASEGAAAAAPAAAPDDGDGDDGAAERAAQAALEEKLRRETAQLTAERTSLLAEREALLSRQDAALRERASLQHRRKRAAVEAAAAPAAAAAAANGGAAGDALTDDSAAALIQAAASAGSKPTATPAVANPTAAAAATTTPAITVKVVNAGATGGKVDADGVKRDDKGAVAETYFKLKRTTALSKLTTAYRQRHNVGPNVGAFSHNGATFSDTMTPAQIGLAEGDAITFHRDASTAPAAFAPPAKPLPTRRDQGSLGQDGLRCMGRRGHPVPPGGPRQCRGAVAGGAGVGGGGGGGGAPVARRDLPHAPPQDSRSAEGGHGREARALPRDLAAPGRERRRTL